MNRHGETERETQAESDLGRAISPHGAKPRRSMYYRLQPVLFPFVGRREIFECNDIFVLVSKS